MMKTKHIWMFAVIGIVALLVSVNVLVIERKVAHTLAVIDLGMTQSDVIKVAGEPDDKTTAKYYDESSGQKAPIGAKKHFGYYFSYAWDYVLIFPLNHARSIRVVFGADDRVEEVETRGYFSRCSYVEKRKQSNNPLERDE